MPVIRIAQDMFKEVEKQLKYKFWDKERERSNHAASMAEMARGQRRLCPLRHQRISWSGPPNDPIRAYICIDCWAVACEPEIVDMGYDFDTVPDWVQLQILDLDLERQAAQNPASTKKRRR